MVLLLSAAATAQVDQARISGMIRDSQGAVIPGVMVMTTNENNGEVRTATSNSSGFFVLAGVAPGQYSIVAKTQGFAPAQFEHVPVGVGQERTVDIVLAPESVQTSITIDGGEMVMIDVSSARVGVNVGEREVDNIPLNGRQLSQLYLMAPGAVTSGGGTYDNIRFSGRANQENAIRFDGIEGTSIIDASPGNLNGESSSAFRLQTSLENVQEFRVESNNYPAEYGTGTGGQVSVITKSGSNSFHGAAFEYLRNDKMDARNFFDRESVQLPDGKSPLRMNQFGGSLGGPLRKDKAFFFLSYEGLRQRVGVPFVESVPSETAWSRAAPSIQPFRNVFPRGTDPTSNADLDNATFNGRQSVDENAFGVRLDYRFNDAYSIYARYFRDQGESFLPTGVTGNGFAVTSVPQNGVVEMQQVITPSVLNETKFGFNGSKTRTSGFVPDYPGVDLRAAAVIIGGGSSLAGIGGQGTSSGVATPTGLVRASSATNGRGQPYTNYTLSFIDNLSWIKESHSTKFGVEIRPIRIKTDRLGGATYSYNSLNDFLNNAPSSVRFLGDLSAPSPFNGGATGPRHAQQTYFIWYGQDEWRLRPNLTMNYGLRYEYYSVIKEENDLAVVFDVVNGGLLPSNTPFYRSSKANFGPRLAVSWSPTRFKDKTVIRVGSGFYYGPGQTEDQIQPIESDRVDRNLTSGVAFPIDPAAIIAGYDINSPTLGFQPRAYAPGYRLPERILSYTASLQQELPSGMVLTLAYVGSQGRNLFLRGWTNKIVGVSTNATTGAAVVTREFGGRFGEVDFKTTGGTDHYDALQMSLNRRLARGFTTGLQWTWAHSIGNTAGSNEARTAQDTTNFEGERGNNNFDVRHSFNWNALYELPFGSGRRLLSNSGALANAVIGGWQVGGVFNVRSGLPIEVGIVRPDTVFVDQRNGLVMSNPVCLDGSGNMAVATAANGTRSVPTNCTGLTAATVAVINTPFGGNSRNIRRPNVVPGVDPYLHGDDKTAYLNPAAFSMPAPGTYGNLARNALKGPGLMQFDLTLHKRFIMTERTNLEFRAEFYNLFNRANFANPPSSLANALGTVTLNSSGVAVQNPGIQPGQTFTASGAGGAFGRITSTVDKTVGLGTSRQIQLSLRLNF
jgi:hypothetical protein